MSKITIRKPRQTVAEPAAAEETAAVVEMTSAQDERPIRRRIAERAYFVWLANGKPSDQHLANWYQAEVELLPTDG